MQADSFVTPEDGRCPVDALPPELLAHIFLLGTTQKDPADAMPEADRRPWHTSRRIPVAISISHVCSRRRDIAISTSALWTDVHFVVDRSHVQPRLYLERAKNALLDIYVDFAHPDVEKQLEWEIEMEYPEEDPELGPWLLDRQSDRADEVEEVLELIIPHINQWRSFKLWASVHLPMHMAMLCLTDCPPAPMLEELDLRGFPWQKETSFPRPQWEEERLPFQGKAPNLKRVSICGVSLHWEEVQFLEGLTELHLRDLYPSYLSSHELVRILHNSPGLRNLTLVDSLSVDRLESQSATLSFPSIQRLMFHGELEEMNFIIKRLAFPNLHTLDCVDLDASRLLSNMSFKELDSDKAPLESVRALRLGIERQCSVEIPYIFPALSDLTMLSIDIWHGFEWYRALMADPPLDEGAPTIYMPHLQVLYLGNVTARQVRELVQRRKAQGLPLLRVHVFKLGFDINNSVDEEWLRDNLEGYTSCKDGRVADLFDADVDAELGSRV